MGRSELQALRALALDSGIQLAYRNAQGRRTAATTDALFQTLRALHAPLDRISRAEEVLQQRRRQRAARGVEPVIVAWNGHLPPIHLILKTARTGRLLSMSITDESGAVVSWEQRLHDVPVHSRFRVAGVDYCRYDLIIRKSLPLGYHVLTIRHKAASFQALLIAAPRQGEPQTSDRGGRLWGVFMPLYALRRRPSDYCGTYSDLSTLLQWVQERGGSLVGTLPLLAQFLDEPFEPSPYAPVSRLFWNEFYLDVQSAGGNPSMTPRGAQGSLLDYRRLMARKRRDLEKLSRAFFKRSGGRSREFQDFIANKPEINKYAAFRASLDKRRDARTRHYHLYVQWQAHVQLETAAREARHSGPGLYLDLPLGVHRDGFDTWRWPELFALNADAGAPPDDFFAQGQCWDFPPLHPEVLRETHYHYWIEVLRNHLRYAGILRIDHVMGLHRLFWIPQGMAARDGVYVRYPHEEWYAVLLLEARRYGTWLVGENLGTVPEYVNRSMRRHKIHPMYVFQYEMTPRRKRPPAVASTAVASLNTHDMFPFAAYWRGDDIVERRKEELVDASGMKSARQGRRRLKKHLERFFKTTGSRRVFRACLEFLAASPARVVLVNLEDLWGETNPHNLPETKMKRRNWQRAARYSFQEFCQKRPVLDTLRTVNRLRQRGKSLR